MPKQTLWGIYRGFNPHSESILKWQTPKCSRCGFELKPWIDWWSYGCVGYCVDCDSFFVVKSHMRPADGIHRKAEVEQLERHELMSLDSVVFHEKLNNKLWELHESIPLSDDATRQALKLFGELEGGCEQTVLLGHLLWSLVLNSRQISVDHLESYLSFTFENPHYTKIGDIYVWIGHEYDIAEYLDSSFGLDVIKFVYKLYNNSSLSSSDFRKRVGFYITPSNKLLEAFDEQFQNYAKEARARFAI